MLTLSVSLGQQAHPIAGQSHGMKLAQPKEKPQDGQKKRCRRPFIRTSEDSWGPGLNIIKSLATPDVSHGGHISAASLMATCLLMESGNEVGR